MIALKVLLTVAGVLLMAAALTIPLYGLWLRIRYAQKKTSGDETVVEPSRDCVAWSGGAGAGGMPAAAGGDEHGGGAERHGRREGKPDWGNDSGNAVSGIALRYATGGDVQTFDLREHLFTAGMWSRGASLPKKGRTERAVARRSESSGWR